MSKSDFVGDFITVIRNASRARKDKVTAQTSNMTTRIAEILKEEGFVESVKSFEEGPRKFVRIHLKYVQDDQAAIQGIQRVSTPGCRTYSKSTEIPKVQGGLGIAIVSTSKGIVTDRQARKDNIGGEILCKVW